jgi:hypothetical protein
LVVDGLCSGAGRDSEFVAKDLAQAGVDVKCLGDVALGGQGAHEHLITRLPERGQSDELAAGPNCCWELGPADPCATRSSASPGYRGLNGYD